MHTHCKEKKSIFKTQTSNWTQSGLWFVLPGFLSSAYQNISKQSTDHLRLPDINSILLPTPCSHLIAFEIAQCPTWKDYYSNAGSSFLSAWRRLGGVAQEIQSREEPGVPTLKPSWRAFTGGYVLQKMINALGGGAILIEHTIILNFLFAW